MEHARINSWFAFDFDIRWVTWDDEIRHSCASTWTKCYTPYKAATGEGSHDEKKSACFSHIPIYVNTMHFSFRIIVVPFTFRCPHFPTISGNTTGNIYDSIVYICFISTLDPYSHDNEPEILSKIRADVCRGMRWKLNINDWRQYDMVLMCGGHGSHRFKRDPSWFFCESCHPCSIKQPQWGLVLWTLLHLSR